MAYGQDWCLTAGDWRLGTSASHALGVEHDPALARLVEAHGACAIAVSLVNDRGADAAAAERLDGLAEVPAGVAGDN